MKPKWFTASRAGFVCDGCGRQIPKGAWYLKALEVTCRRCGAKDFPR